MRSEGLTVDGTMDGVGVNPNLLEGTNFGKPMVFSMIADPSFAIYSEDMYPCVEVGYGWGFRSKNMTLQPGTYTISCLAKSALDTPSQPRISSTDIFGIKYFDLIDNTKWVPLKHSFTLTETKTGIFYFLAEDTRGRVKFAQIKLEAGDGSTAYVVHPNDLIPPIKWVGTSLKINDGVPVQLKGEKGDTGEFSPEQSAMLSAHEVSINQHGNQINQQGNAITQHEQTINEHTQSITELTQNFGMEVPSILISNTQQYIQVLEEIEQQAMAKSGKVCSTIRLTSSEMPIILPCPEKFVDRQITIARLAEPLNYCAMFHDVIYIHTAKSPSSVGVLAGGSMPFNNFVYYSQAPAFSGCKGYRINQNVTGLNKFRALTEIDCNQSLSLTFLAVNYSGGYRWLLMDVSAFDAHISPNEAGTIWRAVQQVRGQEPWTIKHNGQIIPASKHSTAMFTVTEMMGWIEYNGSGRTTTMDFPASLLEGFMCYVQNNARQPLTVTGCSPVGTLRDVPARSLCLCRKGTRNNMLIFQISTI